MTKDTQKDCIHSGRIEKATNSTKQSKATKKYWMTVRLKICQIWTKISKFGVNIPNIRSNF